VFAISNAVLLVHVVAVCLWKLLKFRNYAVFH